MKEGPVRDRSLRPTRFRSYRSPKTSTPTGLLVHPASRPRPGVLRYEEGDDQISSFPQGRKDGSLLLSHPDVPAEDLSLCRYCLHRV